ncbi:MAG: hypothetical protein WAM21_03220 [Steroidobacteraceae bacterium]
MTARKARDAVIVSSRALREDLRGYPPDRIDQFLEGVHLILELSSTMACAPLTETERLKRLKRTKRAAEKFCGLLDDIVSALEPGRPVGPMIGRLAQAIASAGGIEELSQRHRDGWRPEETCAHAEEKIQRIVKGQGAEPDQSDLHCAWMAAAQSVYYLSSELGAEIDRISRAERRGRRSADADGYLAQIALLYERCFGERPKATKYGPYWNVIAEITGGGEVERQVRASLTAFEQRKDAPL